MVAFSIRGTSIFLQLVDGPFRVRDVRRLSNFIHGNVISYDQVGVNHFMSAGVMPVAQSAAAKIDSNNTEVGRHRRLHPIDRRDGT